MIKKARFIALFFVVLLGVVMSLFFIDYTRFSQLPLQFDSPQIIEVEPGSSQHGLINSWRKKSWLRDAQRDPLWLRLHQRLINDKRTIKAGEYELRPGQTLLQALDSVQSGDNIRHSFTIIEGWNFADVRKGLASTSHLLHVTATWSDAEIMSQLGHADRHPEGQFLPETYNFSRHTKDIEILRQAQLAMAKALQDAWQERATDLPLRTPYEVLTLASIVEKETALAEERALIAGVFVNRLRIGMRLQTDPTVIYGLGASFDGNIRRRDLTADTPYNTYTRSGLPPTPIAMPGRDALMASGKPAQTDKLYFVATGAGGRHYFSKNLQEHQSAVRRYQLKK
ncbi:MAG: endolytic transglycosylase MltG [Oceanococcus sp.]